MVGRGRLGGVRWGGVFVGFEAVGRFQPLLIGLLSELPVGRVVARVRPGFVPGDRASGGDLVELLVLPAIAEGVSGLLALCDAEELIVR